MNVPSIARLSTVSCLATKSHDTSVTNNICLCLEPNKIMYCANRKASDCKNTCDMSFYIPEPIIWQRSQSFIKCCSWADLAGSIHCNVFHRTSGASFGIHGVMAHPQRHLMSFPQNFPWFSPCASAPPIGFVRCKLNILHSIDGADARGKPGNRREIRKNMGLKGFLLKNTEDTGNSSEAYNIVPDVSLR